MFFLIILLVTAFSTAVLIKFYLLVILLVTSFSTAVLIKFYLLIILLVILFSIAVLEYVWYCGSCCGCGLKKVIL
jgi:hypothetical protein